MTLTNGTIDLQPVARLFAAAALVVAVGLVLFFAASPDAAWSSALGPTAGPHPTPAPAPLDVAD